MTTVAIGPPITRFEAVTYWVAVLVVDALLVLAVIALLNTRLGEAAGFAAAAAAVGVARLLLRVRVGRRLARTTRR